MYWVVIDRRKNLISFIIAFDWLLPGGKFDIIAFDCNCKLCILCNFINALSLLENYNEKIVKDYREYGRYKC